MAGCIRGATSQTAIGPTMMTRESIPPMLWDVFPEVPARIQSRICVGTCWSGRGVCGGSTLILWISKGKDSEKIWMQGEMWPVCCGAARSPAPSGSCGVPFASGTTRSVRTGSSGFGWCCSQAVELSGLCPSGLWGRPEGFSPLVIFAPLGKDRGRSVGGPDCVARYHVLIAIKLVRGIRSLTSRGSRARPGGEKSIGEAAKPY
jgi:hypothetical protein